MKCVSLTQTTGRSLLMPKRKKPYFHNNVEAIRDAPDEYFMPLEYDTLMDAKLHGYHLPATVLCIIKEYKHNGKVKEHIYQRGYAANRKIKQMIMEGHEFTVIDQDGCQHVVPTIPLYDDPLA